MLLTVELEDGVVHFTLHLTCALERTGHPQSFVHGDRSDDVVPDVGRHLPLGHNCTNYESNHAQKSQGESQNLKTGVSHFYFFFSDLTLKQQRTLFTCSGTPQDTYFSLP